MFFKRVFESSVLLLGFCTAPADEDLYTVYVQSLSIVQLWSECQHISGKLFSSLWYDLSVHMSEQQKINLCCAETSLKMYRWTKIFIEWWSALISQTHADSRNWIISLCGFWSSLVWFILRPALVTSSRKWRIMHLISIWPLWISLFSRAPLLAFERKSRELHSILIYRPILRSGTFEW